jgi:hypothetical protein
MFRWRRLLVSLAAAITMTVLVSWVIVLVRIDHAQVEAASPYSYGIFEGERFAIWRYKSRFFEVCQWRRADELEMQRFRSSYKKLRPTEEISEALLSTELQAPSWMQGFSRIREKAYWGDEEIAAGFPFLALTCTMYDGSRCIVGNPRGGVDVQYLSKVGVDPKKLYMGFPTTPLWPGFLLNTLCYWLMSSILIALIVDSKRLRRLSQGRCPVCGYDTSAAPDSPCPECGSTKLPAPIESAK